MHLITKECLGCKERSHHLISRELSSVKIVRPSTVFLVRRVEDKFLPNKYFMTQFLKTANTETRINDLGRTGTVFLFSLRSFIAKKRELHIDIR